MPCFPQKKDKSIPLKTLLPLCFNSNSGDTGGLVLDDFTTWDEDKYAFVKEVLWQQNGKFVGLDHEIPLGSNGITLSQAK